MCKCSVSKLQLIGMGLKGECVNMYVFIYFCICVCVCMCVLMCIGAHSMCIT